MALFKNEKWEVVPQMEENVFHGEDVSHVGYLIRSTGADGSQTDIVDGYGIGRSELDRDAAVLFAASKDLFNAAELLTPLLPLLREQVDVDPQQEAAMRMLDAVVRHVNENTSEAARTPAP